ncbi:MAG TPA: hypothetical protein VFW03_18405 [Gemmatimonadaceae bacterium]|nr:hypothetical protein [Gemmatimonadaceae bacterium]
MAGIKHGDRSEPSTPDASGDAAFRERRHGGGVVARRAAVGRAIGRHRLEDFRNTLTGLAVDVFGQQATVVAHLRSSSGREWVTFVIDAADPMSVTRYEDYVTRERAFWTAYSQVTKPVGVQFIVAIRPARGWCRVEALAPLFSTLQPPDALT